MRAACSGGVDLDDPNTWPAGAVHTRGWLARAQPQPVRFTEPTVHRGADRWRCFGSHPPGGAAVDAADSNDPSDPAERSGHGVGTS